MKPQNEMQPKSVSAFSFRRSMRYKKARFSRFFDRKKSFIWLGIALALVILGGCLVYIDIKIGYSLGALALWVCMLVLWYRWDLHELAIKKDHTLELDQLLASDVLRDIKWPTNPQQLWQSLSKNWQWRFIVSRFGVDPSHVTGQLSTDGARLQAVWQMSNELLARMGLPSMTAGALTVALIASANDSKSYLASLKISIEDLINGVLWQERLDKILHKLQQKSHFGGLGRDWSAGFTPMLNRFAHNLSAEVENGGVAHLNIHLYGGSLRQVVTALSQPTKNSVVVLGEVGSGKTTLVYSLAEQLLAGSVPPELKYYKVMSLSASVLISQVRERGELEALVLQLLTEAVKAKNIILFLDDAHLFFTDEAGGVNLTNTLLPILEGGRIRFVLAMEPGQWQKLIANASTLTAILNQQVLPSPSQDEVLNVLEDQVIGVEGQTKTLATYQAVQEAYRLAERYVQDQVFPGKGIALLTTAANYAQAGVITPASVQAAVEGSLGVKVASAGAPEKAQLLNLEDQLHQRMINQTYAVKVVSDALRRARAGVRNPNRPVGSFLFLGPTGVGKTELSKALAGAYFGGAGSIVRVDMSEYAQPSDVSRLLEPSNVNANGFLSQIRQKPFSVVLLDEVEKAHPDILNLLLQLFDEGRLTDSGGREASFRDALVIATSNAGADDIRARIEAGQSLEQFSDEFVNTLINSQQFRPELINRFDEVVLFRPLTPEELQQVVALMVNDVNATLAPQKVQVELTPAAITWLVQQGYDPRLGARPMRRMVQRSVENVVAQKLLSEQAPAGSTIKLDVADLQSTATA